MAYGASDSKRGSDVNIALDRGYDTGAVHLGLELLGITGNIPPIQFSNSPEKYGFYYLSHVRCFFIVHRAQNLFTNS